MRLNRLGAFTLGVIITAVSVGAVSFANAAGNGTLKACANKTTGAMRYISKGSCKKTETSLAWNQMGPQGLPGSAGATGVTGANGASGANGQNFHVIDAEGRDLGTAIGLWNSGQSATIIYEGGLWELSSLHSLFNGAINSPRFYSDSSCFTPIAEVNQKMQSMARGWDGNEVNPKYWKLSGSSFLMSSRTIYGKVRTGSAPNYTFPCTASTVPSFYTWFFEGAGQDPYLSALTEVTPPPYTAPFSIVAK